MLLLQAFKDGDIRFLICTDVAARGIDVAGLPYVINMTLPDRSEDYIHRVGRVGKLWPPLMLPLTLHAHPPTPLPNVMYHSSHHITNTTVEMSHQHHPNKQHLSHQFLHNP